MLRIANGRVKAVHLRNSKYFSSAGTYSIGKGGSETEKMSMRRQEGKSKGRGRTRAKWLLLSISSLYRREWGAIDIFEGE